MARAELDRAVDWAAGEGWNPGAHDAVAFHACDPKGFVVGLLDGEPIGSISVVRYPAGFAFLGFYLVAPAWRGRGYGFQLWQAGMARVGDCNVGLDGVVAQQPNYKRSGFALAYRNIRYGGDPPAVAAPAGLVDARSVPFDMLVALDRTMFPAPRAGFLSNWVSLPGHRALAALDDGRITGFGVLRPCRNGAKIGPLYADDRAVAERLVRGLAAGVAGPVFLDVPEPNREAIALANAFDWTPQFETARMYTAKAPAIALQRLYGVTTFELG
jgi:ribosomal protein S18 acetylase RimI-like enzyme